LPFKILKNYTSFENVLSTESFNRKLLHSFLKNNIRCNDLKTLDVAGAGRYAEIIQCNDIYTLNIVGNASYNEDIEGDCSTVPRNSFDRVICSNYMLLAKDPKKVIDNIYSFLKPKGKAIIDFHSLLYWYKGGDGQHWQLYNPTSIDFYTSAFKHKIFIPLGNSFLACLNYYQKSYTHNKLINLLFNIIAKLGSFDKNPDTAITYMAILEK